MQYTDPIWSKFCAVYAGGIRATFILFSGEAWFYLSRYINFWKNNYWSVENCMLIMGCHCVMLWLMCAML